MTRPTRDPRGNAPIRPRHPGNLTRAVTILAAAVVLVVGAALVVAAGR